MSDGRTPFGGWLRRRRKLLDLTQQGLADLVGCSPVTIRKLEAGDRRASRSMAFTLALALMIPEREREAFVQFARSSALDDGAFSLPAWDPDLPTWREGQMPLTRPERAPGGALRLIYDLIGRDKPSFVDVGDGRRLFTARAEGAVSGEFSGRMTFEYVQIVHPKPEGFNIRQALPERVSAAFTAHIGEEQLSGACIGVITPQLDARGNGVGRFQASGHVTSTSIGLISYLLGRVFLEDEVRMVEGIGTGARGAAHIEPDTQRL